LKPDHLILETFQYFNVFFQLDPASFYVVVLPVIFFFYWEGLFINGLALSTTCRQLMSSLIEYELETMDVGIETCLLLVKGAWGWQYNDSSCWRSKEFGKILQLVRMTVPAIQLKIVYFRPLIKKTQVPVHSTFLLRECLRSDLFFKMLFI
jgi:hypothetical protein